MACEAADAGLLCPELAAGIRRVKRRAADGRSSRELADARVHGEAGNPDYSPARFETSVWGVIHVRSSLGSLMARARLTIFLPSCLSESSSVPSYSSVLCTHVNLRSAPNVETSRFPFSMIGKIGTP